MHKLTLAQIAAARALLAQRIVAEPNLRRRAEEIVAMLDDAEASVRLDELVAQVLKGQGRVARALGKKATRR